VELIRRNLKRTGVVSEVVEVNSGEAALDFIYRRGPYKERRRNSQLLVLLDINMPGLDGVEVLRQLKAGSSKSNIPVIMLTTTDDPREVERCYEMGCSVYVTKPVAPDQFIDAIRRLGAFVTTLELPREQD
jgi:CheY-like chemotaxis protein